jgi:hypothetical protein
VATVADEEEAVAVAEVDTLTRTTTTLKTDYRQVGVSTYVPNFPVLPVTGPIGARLTRFLPNWAVLTTDQWVLNTIAYGHQWEFHSRPPLYRGEKWRFAPQSKKALGPLTQKVEELLHMHAIEKVVDPASPGFYSRFFVLPKKTEGQWRAILDLKALNQFIVTPKFKMETAESIRRDLGMSKWTTSIDLVDAYLHIPIHKSFRQYLRFVVNGVAYQYRALPAGLSTAPWAFTRIIGVVKIFLHKLGIQLHQYIDDWLIRALTYQLCLDHTRVALRSSWGLWYTCRNPNSFLLRYSFTLGTNSFYC